jgi:alcohol dehydrogenase class IV
VSAALNAGRGAGDALADTDTDADARAHLPDAADAVEALATRLGLPVRMRDVGVRREDLETIAEKTMHEALLKNSRRPVQGPDDIREILERAW